MNQLEPVKPLPRQASDRSYSAFIHVKRVKGLIPTRKKSRARFGRELAEAKTMRERGVIRPPKDPQ